MRKTMLFMFAALLACVSCSRENEDDGLDMLSLTVWKQDVGDKTHWFAFRVAGSLSYTETPLGEELGFNLSKSLRYEIDESASPATIKIYLFTGNMDPATGYPEIDVLLSGRISGNTIRLYGDGIDGGRQAFDLTKYNAQKK